VPGAPKFLHNVGIKSYSIALAFALLVLTACGQVDTSAVAQQAINLKSTVAEAALLAEGAAHDRYTARFTQVRAEEISDDAAQLESSLQESQVAPAARPEAARLRAAARQVVAAMSRLSGAPGDAALAARLKGEMDQIGARLRQT
jgi:hypothetical protein